MKKRSGFHDPGAVRRATAVQKLEQAAEAVRRGDPGLAMMLAIDAVVELDTVDFAIEALELVKRERSGSKPSRGHKLPMKKPASAPITAAVPATQRSPARRRSPATRQPPGRKRAARR